MTTENKRKAGRPPTDNPLTAVRTTVNYTHDGYFNLVHCAQLSGEKIGEFQRRAVEARCRIIKSKEKP